MPSASRIRCPGCQQKVKINRFLNHVQLSTNPLCRQESGVDAAGSDDTESVASQGSQPNTPSEDDENKQDPFLLQRLHSPANFRPDAAYTSDNSDQDQTGVLPSLGIDPTGDLYGDYSLLQYDMDVDDPPEPDEASIGWLEGDVVTTWESEEDEEEVEEEEVHQAQLEHGLEPKQPVHVGGEEVDSDIVENILLLVTPADRDGAEEKLCQRPCVVQFPGLAGTPTATTQSGHARYAELVNEGQESPNIYAPFSSRLE